MRLRTTLYIPADTPIHACDARVKIVLLLAFTIAVFFVGSWWGMALCAGVVLALVAIAKLPAKHLALLMVPVAILALFAVVFNATGAASDGRGAAAGLAAGALVAVRMLLLVLASFIVCFTSSSSELLEGFARLMAPLRALRVPVDDVALVLSMALRFIPMIAEEYQRIHDAQAARGARFDNGSVGARIKAHAAVLIPLFVGLFRRADSIALAMDARCYGLARSGFSASSGEGLLAGESSRAASTAVPLMRTRIARTSLAQRRMAVGDMIALAMGIALLTALALVA